ncbi:MAG: twin-arginine translocase TatA/TatE family subunit [Rariglobus sp.]
MSSTLLTLAFIEGLGGGEMILIFFIILILFGGKRLPELARGLGKSVREFKKATSGVEDEIKRAMEEPAPPRPVRKTPLYTAPTETIEPITTIDSLEAPLAAPVIPPKPQDDPGATPPPSDKPAA